MFASNESTSIISVHDPQGSILLKSRHLLTLNNQISGQFLRTNQNTELSFRDFRVPPGWNSRLIWHCWIRFSARNELCQPPSRRRWGSSHVILSILSGEKWWQFGEGGQTQWGETVAIDVLFSCLKYIGILSKNKLKQRNLKKYAKSYEVNRLILVRILKVGW